MRLSFGQTDFQYATYGGWAHQEPSIVSLWARTRRWICPTRISSLGVPSRRRWGPNPKEARGTHTFGSRGMKDCRSLTWDPHFTESVHKKEIHIGANSSAPRLAVASEVRCSCGARVTPPKTEKKNENIFRSMFMLLEKLFCIFLDAGAPFASPLLLGLSSSGPTPLGLLSLCCFVCCFCCSFCSFAAVCCFFAAVVAALLVLLRLFVLLFAAPFLLPWLLLLFCCFRLFWHLCCVFHFVRSTFFIKKCLSLDRSIFSL